MERLILYNPRILASGKDAWAPRQLCRIGDISETLLKYGKCHAIHIYQL